MPLCSACVASGSNAAISNVPSRLYVALLAASISFKSEVNETENCTDNVPQ